MKDSSSKSIGHIDLLDYTRFVAAIAVMLFHYSYIGIFYGRVTSISYIPGFSEIARYGYLGVELFFMISGYVIFFSARGRTAAQFAAARALRLYPAFIFCVLLTSLIAHSWGGRTNNVAFAQMLANLTMNAPFFHHDFVDGSYWSLIYELHFYALITVLLLLGLARRIGLFFRLWPFILLLGLIPGLERTPILNGYYSYFAAGALFAMRQEKRNWIVDGLLLLCLLRSMHFSLGNHFDVAPGVEAASTLAVGFAVLLFYGIFLLLNVRKMRQIRLPFARKLGAATYPLYLIHQTIGYIIINHFGTAENSLMLLPAIILGMLVLALLINHVVEVRLAFFWRQLFRVFIELPIEKLEFAMARFRLEGRLK